MREYSGLRKSVAQKTNRESFNTGSRRHTLPKILCLRWSHKSSLCYDKVVYISYICIYQTLCEWQECRGHVHVGAVIPHRCMEWSTTLFGDMSLGPEYILSKGQWPLKISRQKKQDLVTIVSWSGVRCLEWGFTVTNEFTASYLHFNRETQML